eukprot:gene7256-7327_t
MALLSSCLKDNSHYVDFAGAKPLVELPAATGIGPAGGEFQAAAFNISSTPVALNVLVNLAAPKPLTSALTVKLSVDQAALTAYNAANGTSYILLPAADYTSTLTATIPANQNEANVVVNINTSLIDPSQSYVLPLTITDGGGPFPFSYTVAMNTTGANSIDGSALADLKADLKLTVNADNSVTVSSSAQPTTQDSPGLVNKYDPSTKTFTLSYFYNTSAPRIITETLKWAFDLSRYLDEN